MKGFLVSTWDVRIVCMCVCVCKVLFLCFSVVTMACKARWREGRDNNGEMANEGEEVCEG